MLISGSTEEKLKRKLFPQLFSPVSFLGYLYRILKNGRRYQRCDGLHLPSGMVWLHWSCEWTAHKKKAGDRHQSCLWAACQLVLLLQAVLGSFYNSCPSFLISQICLFWAYLKQLILELYCQGLCTPNHSLYGHEHANHISKS